jgi:hypothetical protein
VHDREVLGKLAAPLAGWSVRIVGLGGIGSHVAQAVAQFLAYATPDTPLYLIDGDRFEEKNRARMLFESAGNKAVVRSRELSTALNGVPPIIPIPQYLTPLNAGRLIEEHTLLFLCVDNHATRKVVSTAIARRRLRDVVLISGGNDGVEDGQSGTFGNVMIYRRENGRELTNSLTTFHPEIAHPKDKRPDQKGCAELEQSAPQLLITNFAVASGMLMTCYAWLTGQIDYEEIYLDIARGCVRPVRRKALDPGLVH